VDVYRHFSSCRAGKNSPGGMAEEWQMGNVAKVVGRHVLVIARYLNNRSLASIWLLRSSVCGGGDTAG
jgi:hypothetical protein